MLIITLLINLISIPLIKLINTPLISLISGLWNGDTAYTSTETFKSAHETNGNHLMELHRIKTIRCA